MNVFIPADDTPSDSPDSARLVHTEHAARALHSLIQQCLATSNAPQTTGGRPGLCIGLLGGLGQGKTSVLMKVRQGLTAGAKAIKVRALLGSHRLPHIVVFDTANHASDKLEFEFAQLQASLNPGYWLGHFLWRSFWWLALAFGMLALVVALLPSSLASMVDAIAVLLQKGNAGPKGDAAILKTLAASFAPSFIALVGWGGYKSLSMTASRRREMQFLTASGTSDSAKFQHSTNAPNPASKWQYVMALPSKVLGWRWICLIRRAASHFRQSYWRIDVLMIDNLDRASVSQQRAILRTLYKTRGDLPYCIVVAFDEQALLESSADPEVPEALLHKALQVHVRLAPRHPVEAIPLACLAAQALPQVAWRNAFLQPAVHSVFARVLAQMPLMSPRLAKRFVNDVGAALAVIDERLYEGSINTGAQMDEFELAATYSQALFRLRGLEELSPGLWRMADRLTAALGCATDPAHWKAELLSSLDKKEMPSHLQRAFRYLDKTRDVQPLRGDWASYVMVLWSQRWAKRGLEQAQEVAASNRHSVASVVIVPDLLALHHIWRTLDSTAIPGMAQGLNLNVYNVFWPFQPLELDGMLGGDSRSPEIKSRARQWLLQVLDLWADHHAGDSRRMNVLHHLRNAVGRTGSWLAEGDDEQLIRAGIVNVAMRCHEGINSKASIKSWMTVDPAASSRLRLARLALCDAALLDWCDVWQLVAPQSKMTELSALYEPKLADSAPVMQWLARVPEPQSTSLDSLAGALQLLNPIDSDAVDLLTASWPSRPSVWASDTTLSVMHWRLYRVLHLSDRVPDFFAPPGMVAAIQMGAYAAEDVWVLFSDALDSSYADWSVGSAVRLASACNGLGRLSSASVPMMNWAIHPKAYAAYLLWAAMLGWQHFKAAWETQHKAIDLAPKMVWMNDSEWLSQLANVLQAYLPLLHQADEKAWMKDEVIGQLADIIRQRSELAQLPFYIELLNLQPTPDRIAREAQMKNYAYDPSNLPVVFIHGLVGTWGETDQQSQLMPLEVHAPDLLGYGEYSSYTGSVDLHAQAAHIAAYVERCFPDLEQKVNIVGHSIGGVIAFLYAHKHPKRVDKIVSAEGNFQPADAFWSKALAQKSLADVAVQLKGWQDNPVSLFRQLEGIDKAQELEIARKWFFRQDARVIQQMAASVVAVTDDPGFENLVKSVCEQHSIHLIAGEHSAVEWHPFEFVRQIATSNTVVDAAGHMMMLDNPKVTGIKIRSALIPVLPARGDSPLE